MTPPMSPWKARRQVSLNVSMTCANQDNSVVQALKELGTEWGCIVMNGSKETVYTPTEEKSYVLQDSQLRLDIVKLTTITQQLATWTVENDWTCPL